MKKSFSALFVVLFTLSLFRPSDARAELPAKPKAFLTIVGYGTAGGAILGAASMAFGANSRAIAQGASLGLYAGILFGTYVLVSHHQKRYGSYDDNSSPYQDSSDIYGDDYQDDEGGSREPDNQKGGFFDRYQNIHEERINGQNLTVSGSRSRVPPIHLNILQYNF